MALTGNVYGNQATAAAWCYFTSITTTAINDSFNVASLTDQGTGHTTINLSITMSNTNYAVAGSAYSGAYGFSENDATARTTTAFATLTFNSAHTATDIRTSVLLFGDRA